MVKGKITSEPYRSGDFCRAINCPNIKEIDRIDPKNKAGRDAAKERLCADCKAREFHQYLKRKKFMIAHFHLGGDSADDDADIDSEKKE
jgi:hypothetical protein